MANDRNYRKKKRKLTKKQKRIIIFILFAILFFVFEIARTYSYEEKNKNENQGENEPTFTVEEVEGTLEMHVIDVGQGDSILFVQDDYTMLIDTGTRGRGEDVVKYLQDQGISKIDILVGTHLHDDHMGGMEDVINNMDIGVLYFPMNDESTTNWYMNLLEAISEKDVTCKEPNTGETTSLGEAKIQFLGPISEEYSNTNNYSIPIRISFGEIDFLLTGDAEKEVEEELLASGFELESEIMKAGHHGSDTSNTYEFVEAVNPDYVCISCGFGNKYGHPIKSIMEMYEDMNISVFRTDESGSIVITTDGKEIDSNVKPGDYLSGEELEDVRSN